MLCIRAIGAGLSPGRALLEPRGSEESPLYQEKSAFSAAAAACGVFKSDVARVLKSARGFLFIGLTSKLSSLKNTSKHQTRSRLFCCCCFIATVWV